MQQDRNPNNIGFQIPKIDGVNYKQRLRPDTIIKSGNSKAVKIEKNGLKRIKGFMPSKVYDNERIFGVDHKNVFLHNPKDVWTPIWPYNDKLSFESQEQAKKVQDDEYDGFDPNLTELLINHPEYIPIIERLAYDDEYKKVLEEFSKPNSQVTLMPKTEEYFENILEERREVFKKVLKL